MKNIFTISAIVLILAACKKSELEIRPHAGKQACDFSLTLSPNNLKKKPHTPPNGSINPQGKPVVLIDFDGHTVSGTGWNWNGPIICAGSGLNTDQMNEVMAKVAAALYPWDVLITTSEVAYNAAPANRRTRVILTTTWEPFGMAGGMAFINSFTWSDGTPCFVFTSLLNYNTKFIKEATIHEIGHTLGLYHQSVCDENGVLLQPYNLGGYGTAPIMGNAYYQPVSQWITGTDNNCETQNDISIITQTLRLK